MGFWDATAGVVEAPFVPLGLLGGALDPNLSTQDVWNGWLNNFSNSPMPLSQRLDAADLSRSIGDFGQLAGDVAAAPLKGLLSSAAAPILLLGGAFLLSRK